MSPDRTVEWTATLTVRRSRPPDPDCDACDGSGEVGFVVDGDEQFDTCVCCADEFRDPTPADLAAHLRALPEAEAVAVLRRVPMVATLLLAVLEWIRRRGGAPGAVTMALAPFEVPRG